MLPRNRHESHRVPLSLAANNLRLTVVTSPALTNVQTQHRACQPVREHVPVPKCSDEAKVRGKVMPL